MTDTANLGLPCIEAAQAQKHVTHNEALRLIDTLVQLAVLDRDLAAPPGSPAEGQRWIVAASPTGAWAGHATHVAAWQDSAWQFSVPQTGWIAFVVDEGTLATWNGTAWGDFFSTVTAIQNLALLGVGTTADSTNPLSAKLNNVLWAAKTTAEGGSGDLRYKLSKATSANTVSFLLQDNFSGRAEIGLTGDDNLSVKTSPDGSTFTTAATVNCTTGATLLAALSLSSPLPAGSGGTGVASVPAPHSGRLVYASATSVTFKPLIGDLIKINGVLRQIPAAGIAGGGNTGVFVNGTGASNLAASTLYYVYAFDNAGTLTFDFSTSGHAVSATSGNAGTEIKSGDDSRTLIGLIYTNSASQFTRNLTLSWFNRRTKAIRGSMGTSRSTSSASFVELSSADRLEFLTWGDEDVALQSTALGTNSGSSTDDIYAIGLDGISIFYCKAVASIPAAGADKNMGSSDSIAGLSEGHHYLTPAALVGGGTISFNPAYTFFTAIVRG